jgi:glycosyltransferase involved in cell wall biosynthesis
VLPNEALFFKSGDVDDLRQKMLWALEHPREMNELTARAEAVMRSRHQWPEVIDQYEVLYEALT